MQLNTDIKEAWWLEQMLDRANMATSYKAYWMMSIIDIITEEERSEITFVEVVNRMIKHAWYPVVTYKLSFGVQDRLSHLVNYLFLKYPKMSELKSHELLDFLSSGQLSSDKYFVKKRKELHQMVPYRLLSPFFKTQTKGLKDQKKNQLIVELAQEDYISMYTIDQEYKTINIRRNWMDYIIDNQALVKGWIKYKLALYLQARNPNIPNIMSKLEVPGSRNLGDAKKFWRLVIERKSVKDIYTGLDLDSQNFSEYGSLSIDHFIPWSYVTHDEFWNLCPTFRNVNSSKSDGLPDLDRYMSGFCDIHYLAINELKELGNNKILEDYYTLGHDEMMTLLSGDDVVSKEVVTSVLSQSIKPIHQIALNQGFGIWSNYNL